MQCGAGIANLSPKNINLYRFLMSNYVSSLEMHASTSADLMLGDQMHEFRHFISFHHADNLHYNELQIHPLTKFYLAFLFQSSICIFCALRSSCRSQHLWPPQVKNLICWGIRYIPQIWLVSVFLLLKVLLSHNRLWAQLQSQWAMVSLLETKIIWVCCDFGKKLQLKDVCSP